MARKRVPTVLPPLREVFASFSKFDEEQNQQQIITTMIRDCAQQLQGDEAQPFYTMRDVAAFFDVSLRTVALSYGVLDMEGVLCRIRGSGTMLAGKQTTSRQPVNAIVGLPIKLQSMITSPFECRLQMNLEEKLRHRGFVADSIFFRTHEESDPNFTDRLVRHNLDIVIWHSPHPLSSHVLMSLRDRGIRLVLLQSTETPLQIPARTHLLEWQEAYAAMARQWHADGIRRVFVPEAEQLICRRAMRQLKPLIEEAGMEFIPIEATAASLAEHLLSQEDSARQSVLVFSDPEIADTLCNAHPEMIEKISEHARIAFCRGPVRVPRLITQRICVDVVEINADTLAEGVIKDLCDLKQKQEGVRMVFHAEYRPQVIMD